MKIKCKRCHGKKIVMEETTDSIMGIHHVCPRCNGTGYEDTELEKE